MAGHTNLMSWNKLSKYFDVFGTLSVVGSTCNGQLVGD